MVPCQYLRRNEAQQADPQIMRPAGTILHLTGEQQIGRQERLILGGRCAAPDQDIAARQGKARLRQGFRKPVEAKVEFVIAKRARVIADLVHGGDDGMRSGPALIWLRGKIGERRALQDIAIIQQQAVCRPNLGPCVLD